MSNLKRTLYPLLEPIASPIIGRLFGKDKRPLTADKTNSGELLREYSKSHTDDIHRALRESKFHRHTWLSTLKYVVENGEKHYEISSWVYFPEGADSEWQTHLYVIPVGDVVRVYAHYEKSIFRPYEHQYNTSQLNGDPQNHVDFLP
jgi:hypothetical protein